jgi:hypothetical protein
MVTRHLHPRNIRLVLGERVTSSGINESFKGSCLDMAIKELVQVLV